MNPVQYSATPPVQILTLDAESDYTLITPGLVIRIYPPDDAEIEVADVDDLLDSLPLDC